MEKVNLLFVINDLERGGPEMRLLDFAKYFPDDMKMHICVTSEDLALLEEFEKCKVNIKVIPVVKSYLEFNKIKKICGYIKKNQITIVNSLDLKGLIISVICKLIGNKQLKVIHHTINMHHKDKLRQKIIHWFMLKLVDASICNSNLSKKYLQNKYISKDKINVIYNGVDADYYDKAIHYDYQLRKKHNIDNDEIVLGTVANFRKQKNYPFLIDTFKILSDKYSNLRLLCVGGGKCYEEVEGIVKKYGLENKVIFTGYINNVAAYLSIMNIFVLSSLWEGLPNAILQAMCMGIPVISSSVGGCKEIIENLEDGILFEPNNKEEFIDGVRRLIEDKELASKLVRNAKNKIDDKFSLNIMIDNYSNYYRHINRSLFED